MHTLLQKVAKIHVKKYNQSLTHDVTSVKQAIAWQRFIPFHKFFSHQSKAFDSPGGALLLHWVFSCITIAIVNASSDAYAFNIGIFSYGYEVIMGMCCFPLDANLY